MEQLLGVLPVDPPALSVLVVVSSGTWWSEGQVAPEHDSLTSDSLLQGSCSYKVAISM